MVGFVEINASLNIQDFCHFKLQVSINNMCGCLIEGRLTVGESKLLESEKKKLNWKGA